MTFKQFLWQIGLRNTCPSCGSEVWEVGYLKDDFCQRYKCSNEDCDWGKEVSIMPMKKWAVYHKGKIYGMQITCNMCKKDIEKDLLKDFTVKEVREEEAEDEIKFRGRNRHKSRLH